MERITYTTDERKKRFEWLGGLRVQPITEAVQKPGSFIRQMWIVYVCMWVVKCV